MTRIEAQGSHVLRICELCLGMYDAMVLKDV